MVERKDMFGKAATQGRLESAEETWLPRAGFQQGVTAVEFRRKGRSWFSFPYSYLIAVEFAPSGTQDRPEPHLAAQFSGHRVIVKGSNLGGLYEEIRMGRATHVAEMDRSEIMALGEDAAIVEEISVEEI